MLTHSLAASSAAFQSGSGLDTALMARRSPSRISPTRPRASSAVTSRRLLRHLVRARLPGEVRRHGRLYVINKKEPRFKGRQRG